MVLFTKFVFITYILIKWCKNVYSSSRAEEVALMKMQKFIIILDKYPIDLLRNIWFLQSTSSTA